MEDELFDDLEQEISELPTTEQGFLYVMYAEGTRWIKIGIAVDVEVRQKQLQIGCPLPLRLLVACQTTEATALEKCVHAHFAPYHLHGEWFEVPDNVSMVFQLLAQIFQYAAPASIQKIPPLSDRQRKLVRVEERILSALGEGELFSIRGLMQQAGVADAQYGYMRKLLMRMASQGQIKRERHGLYTARE